MVNIKETPFKAEYQRTLMSNHQQKFSIQRHNPLILLQYSMEVDKLEVVKLSLWEEVVKLLHGIPGSVTHPNHYDAQRVSRRLHDGLGRAQLLHDLAVRYHYQYVISGSGCGMRTTDVQSKWAYGENFS